MRKNKLREELNGQPLWGLPAHISEELVNSYELTAIRKAGKWLFIICLFAVFVPIIMIWIFCEKILSQNAIEAANQIDGFAYHTNFGIGLLIGIFISIFMAGIIICLILRITPMPAKGSLFIAAHTTPPNNSKEKKKTPSAIPSPPNFPFVVTIKDEDLSTESASKLINGYSMKFVFKMGKILSPFIALATVITYLELGRFAILSPQGLHKSTLFSSDLNLKRWQDAERVKLGCNHTKNGAALIYEVIWRDGSDYRLPTRNHINGESWLTNLEAVDLEISKDGAEFVRWKWGVQTPLHRSCLRKFYAELGGGSKIRIDRLLRIGELEKEPK